jgi:CHAT domain-containing protein/tetratricopeptide (TPR) repeat protein
VAKWSLIIALVLAALAALGEPAHAAPAATTGRTPGCNMSLQAGEALDGPSAGEESCLYSISLPARSFVALTVEQIQGRVEVSLEPPGGSLGEPRFCDFGRHSRIALSLISETAGVFKLHITPTGIRPTLAPARAAASWKLRTEPARSVTDSDRAHAAAEELAAHADQLLLKSTPESLQEALRLNDQLLGDLGGLKEAHQIAARLIAKARTLYALQDYQQARSITQQAIQAASGDDLATQLAAHRTLGYADAMLGDVRASIDAYVVALDAAKHLEDVAAQSNLLSNLGRSYRRISEVSRALQALEESVRLARSLDDHTGIARVLGTVGDIHSDCGELQQALDAYDLALRELEYQPDPEWSGVLRNGAGYVYARLGDEAQAMQLYGAALASWTTLGNKAYQAYAFNNIALLQVSRGRSAEAIESYTRALRLLTEQQRYHERPTILTNLGVAYDRAGKPDAALRYFDAALQAEQISPDPRTRSLILNNKGESLLAQGRTDEARPLLQEALELRRSAADRLGEAESLADLARVERSQASLPEARRHGEQALSLIEETRAEVVNRELRVTYFSKARDYYEFYVDLLMQMHDREPTAGYAVLALEASERARARGLVDDLLEAGVDAQIRATGARYAALTQAQPLDLKQVQKDILDQDTTLLEYWLGANASYVWVLKHGELTCLRLPPRKTIETAALTFRRDLSAAALHPLGESVDQYHLRVRQAAARAVTDSQRLARTLLQPVAPYIEGGHLVVVGDGALLWLSFAALPWNPQWQSSRGKAPGPAPQGPAAQPRWLGSEFKLIGLPSLSTLALLRKDASARHTSPTRTAIFADPVFSAADPRVALHQSPAPSGPSLVAASFASVSRVAAAPAGDRLPRLRSSRIEAERIAALLPASAVELKLDFDASKGDFVRHDWSNFRLIHLATHAVLDETHSDLSGVVLSLLDRQGHSQDGFLKVRDIYDLKTPVDLIVLSGCRTALGKEVRGEGLIGLSRAFFFAGGRAVVGSLWSVDDEATAAFMESFYAALLQRRMSAAAALTFARQQLQQSKRFHDPYYWGAFVLTGDWT